MGDKTWLTPNEVSQRTGGAFSEEFVRSATYRHAEHHPLPCVKFGKGGKQRRISWDTFCQWLHEEEGRCVTD